MITLIGTGHVFKLSNQLLNIFDERRPDILCVELDKQRFQGIMLKETNPENYKEQAKKQPYLYRLLAQFQENMAEKYGVKPGDEMLTTINYAQSHQIPLACIDMHAQTMFTRMLKTMTLTEKINFFFSGISGIFVRKKHIEKQIDNISKDVESYLDLIGEKFPTIRRILIDERNTYMAKNIKKINEDHENIIAVMGDGHIPGIKEILEKEGIQPEIIRLHDLQNYEPKEIDTSTASFSFQYE